MVFETKRGLVGITFVDNIFRMAEVQVVGGQYQINKIVQNKMNSPFDIIKHKDNQRVDDLSGIINQAVKSNNVTLERTAFSLDSQMVLMKKVPIDFGLSKVDIKEQVNWEARQFILESINEYIIDFNQLTGEHKKGYQEILVIAVRKAIIDFILKIFSQTNLKIEVIDVNIFSAIRAIRANYECRHGEKIALVDISNDKIMLCFLIGGEYFLSNEFRFFDESDEKKGAFPTDEELTKLISKEIRRLILDHKLGENIEDLDRVFLYGEMVKDEVLETLQNYYDVRIDKVNPFRRLRFASDVSVDEAIWARPETFVVSIGSTLRQH
ncbi:hypothetical protein AMJ86_00535 [bacterium SM23_57]|nr:MAG: hypothetical protein AMJ86_00535 [bacterium SM23_57]